MPNILNPLRIAPPYTIAFVIHVLIILGFCYFFLFKGEGHVVYVDVTEGIRLSDTFNKYFYTFDDNWGEALAEKQRIVPFSLLWGIYQVLPFEISDYIPLKFLFTYVLTLTSFLISIKILLSDRPQIQKGVKFTLALILGTAIYLYNPWMTNRLMHFFLFISSFTLPLVFALTYAYYFIPKWSNTKTLLALGLLLGFFSTTPHTILLAGIIIVTITLFNLIETKHVKDIIRYFLVVGITAVLIGVYWLLPFVGFTPEPDRVESITIVELLGRNASMFNTLKLQGYWWEYLPSYNVQANLDDEYQDLFIYANDVIYIIPFLLLTLLTFTTKRLPKVIIAFFVIGVLFSSLTWFSKPIYSYLMFDSPITQAGWIFREVEKLAYLVGLSYAFGIFYLLIHIKRSHLAGVAMLLLIPTIFIYTYYLFSYMDMNLTKVEVPQDYYKLNQLLDRDDSNYNVAFYPQVMQLGWADRIDSSNYIANLSINKPVLPLSEGDSHTRHYINHILSSSVIPHIDVGEALNVVGVKYLVVRNDHREFDYTSTINLLRADESLSLVEEYQYLTVFENNKFTGLVNIKNTRIVTNLGLRSLQLLSLLDIDYSKTSLEFVDKNLDPNSNLTAFYLFDDAGALDYAITDFKQDFVYPANTLIKSDPTNNWAIGSLTDKTHAESSFYFRNNNIETYQFNYNKEIALSLGGIVVKDLSFFEEIGSPVNFTFERRDGFRFDPSRTGLNVYYSGATIDEVWNILRTEKFPVTNIDSIYVSANVDIPRVLEPHFKFAYYNADDNLIEERPFYAQNSKLGAASNVPSNAVYGEFSIWTRGRYVRVVPWQIANLQLRDATGFTEYPTILTQTTHRCDTNCVLYARVLHSPQSGSMVFYVNDKVRHIHTRSMFSRYMWVPVTEVESEHLNLAIVNGAGVNSIGALVVVDQQALDEKVEEIHSKLANQPNTVNFNQLQDFYYDSDKLRGIDSRGNVELSKISSVEYTAKISGLEESAILSFKKPHSSLWGSNPPIQESGFVNGWVVEADGVYQIYHLPQRYFYLGAVVSALTLFVVFVLIIYENRVFKPRD